jgi:integrase
MASSSTARRVRVERNIYKRPSGVFEVGFKDATGRQRWRTVEGGVQAARAMRDELLTQRRKGGRPSNPRLRFGDSAEAYLASVENLRESTRAAYTSAVRHHLEPRFKLRRLDSLSPEDFVSLVSELRREGLSESSISSVLGVAARIFRYSSRRLGYAGPNPVLELEPGERPKSTSGKRRSFTEAEALATLQAATEPFGLLFLFLAATGARISEALGLRWQDVHLDKLDEAELRFEYQLARKRDEEGRPVLTPLKTDGSARTVAIPRGLAEALAEHKLAAADSSPEAFVFVSARTGTVLWQRNVNRALREAQTRAVDEHDRLMFPELHEVDEHGREVKPERGTIPSPHSFRHSLASMLLNKGESADEIAFMLGHANANVTRAVYLHEVADARRKAMRRELLAAASGSLMEAYEASSRLQPQEAEAGKVLELRRSA